MDGQYGTHFTVVSVASCIGICLPWFVASAGYNTIICLHLTLGSAVLALNYVRARNPPTARRQLRVTSEVWMKYVPLG